MKILSLLSKAKKEELVSKAKAKAIPASDFINVCEILKTYYVIYSDIIANKNLEQRLLQVETDIEFFARVIARAKAEGGETAMIENVKNEWHGLQYEIKERI